MVDPRRMCRQHLLGEHVELHMIVGNHKKGRNLQFMVDRAYIDPTRVWNRHEALVREMKRRGYNHRSPLPRDVCDDFMVHYHDPDIPDFFSDTPGKRKGFDNGVELVRRCTKCAIRVVQALDRSDSNIFWNHVK